MRANSRESSRYRIRKAAVTAYGLWLLAFPQISSPAGAAPLPSLTASGIQSESAVSSPSELLLGRRRSLLRSLRTLAGIRVELDVASHASDLAATD